MLAPCFLIFKLTSPDKTMCNINPFYKQKTMDAVGGNVKNASQRTEKS
jgi:hypothetical protein